MSLSFEMLHLGMMLFLYSGDLGGKVRVKVDYFGTSFPIALLSIAAWSL